MAEEKTFTVEGREIRLAKFKTGTAKAFLARLGASAVPQAEGGYKVLLSNIDEQLDLLHEGLHRANEGLTKEWLEENLDYDQVGELFAAMMEASGMRRKIATEAQGEAKGP